MVKKNIFIFLLHFCAFAINAQNLVPNPSFEIISAPPDTVYAGDCYLYTGGFNIGQVPPWNSATSGGSPDPFNVCSHPISSASVPLNGYGFQIPHSGLGYGAEAFYDHNGAHVVYREYITVKLDTPLVNQEHYCSSFYVSLANTCNYASNNVGMYFSNTSINVLMTWGSLNFIPQINYTGIITDTTNWTLIYGEYTAHGGERYITIGNFYTDSLTDTVSTYNGGVGGVSDAAYYFIDDVNVHCCSCDSTTSIHAGVGEMKEEKQWTINPNPSNGEFNIKLNKEYKNIQIEITDLIGQTIYATKEKETNLISLAINAASGVYFVSIIADDKRQVMKLVKE
jgi:hypothetical protein